jgi:pimeloyl-ACP methyl ester carboxylesterase
VGTLELPAGEGPFPVALLIAGSGPTDRNGNSPILPGANDSLKMVAAALAKAGIASVRYDKRGIGESAAAMRAEEDMQFSDYIDDAVRWIDFLKKDPRFTRVAVIGHSEGSLIGMVAARRAGADAFVSLEGAGQPADELLKSQLAGDPENVRAQAYAIIDSLKAGRTVSSIPEDMTALFRPSVQPYLISWFRYNPQREIARLNMPILIVGGTTDLQVPAKDAELLHAAQPRSTLRIIDGMNHVLKLAPADPRKNVAAYSNPKLPLAPALVSALTDFLTAVLQAPS